MKVIHKYQLRHMSVQTFHAIPCDVKILSIQQQGPDMCMWVEIDPGQKVEKPLVIIIALTGGEAPDTNTHSHFTTCQHGALVMHYYRLKVE